MKRLLPLLALFALLSTPAFAQQDDGSVRVGLGLGLSNSELIDLVNTNAEGPGAASPAGIYLPITFGSFRVEPEFGFFRASTERPVGSENMVFSVSVLRIGTGAFLVRPRGETLLYAGARLGVNRLSSETSSDSDFIDDQSTSSTDLFLGPAAGGEYFFSDHFSLGGEVQIMYTSVGNPDEDEDEDEQFDASITRTRGLFFIRWHF